MTLGTLKGCLYVVGSGTLKGCPYDIEIDTVGPPFQGGRARGTPTFVGPPFQGGRRTHGTSSIRMVNGTVATRPPR
jgi:hypothetical protein